MTPTVSVVIPTYNSAHFLREAIASVHAQQWPALEIIIVDDGSTDDTAAVVNSLAGQGELRFIRQENAGAAAARNAGIAAAQGEWIAFLDADDVWLPQKLSRQFGALEKLPDAVFSFCEVQVLLENGIQRDLSRPKSNQPLLIQLLSGNIFATPSVLVRRDCLSEIGTFDARLRTGEDWDLWLRLAARYAAAPVCEYLVVCRVWDRAKFQSKVLEQCTLGVLEKLFSSADIARRWPQVAAKRSLVYAWHYSVLAKSFLHQGKPGDFLRLAYSAMRAHPAGLRFLAGGNSSLLGRE